MPQRTETCLDCGVEMFADEVEKCQHCKEVFCLDCMDEHENSCVHNPAPGTSEEFVDYTRG